MDSDKDRDLVSNLAWIILDAPLQGGPSSFDDSIFTWSGPVAAQLSKVLDEIRDVPDFPTNLVKAMEGSKREVGLLAVELAALALLPIGSQVPEHVDLLPRLVDAVAGPPPRVSQELIHGVSGPGCRIARTDDKLPDRLLWLAAYAVGICPRRERQYRISRT